MTIATCRCVIDAYKLYTIKWLCTGESSGSALDDNVDNLWAKHAELMCCVMYCV